MSAVSKTEDFEQETSSADYYQIDDLLDSSEREIRRRVRTFVKTEVEPIINDYWERAEFPHELIPKLAALGICGGMIQGYGCPGLSPVAAGLVMMELSRGDGSISSIYGIQSGLVMGAIGLPALASVQKLGCFALTEPQSASNAFMPQTTARRTETGWIINGSKRWIGNANIADVALIWAKEEGSRRLSGFLVETGTPGFHATPIEGRVAKRAVVNCDITLQNYHVPINARLEKAHRFRDISRVLLISRVGVAWEAVGHAMSAYEYALTYAKRREALGKSIAGFQMIQDKLVRMLAAVTSMQLVALRVSQLFAENKISEGQASLAKVHNATLAREVVALAREILGGNGILLDHHVARHFADVEALYTYEGTNEINTLVVGREITGISAFN